MVSVSINIRIDSVKVTSSGSVVGEIFLSVGDIYFPCEKWNDFVLVVLGWWAKAALRILTKISDREVVDFMDGPYYVEVRRVFDDVVLFDMANDSLGKGAGAEGEVNIRVFSQQIVILGKELLRIFRENDYWSNDAENLQSSLASLERELFGAVRH